MRKLRLYLDTSVLSHLFHEDTPERRSATEEFFAHTVATGICEVYISAVVIDEIQRTPDLKRREQLGGVVDRYAMPLLPGSNDQVLRLASLYIHHGIIPLKKADDAAHAALATFHEMDMLVSWNFRHLANVQKEREIQAVNYAEGYAKPLRIITPLEVAAL